MGIRDVKGKVKVVKAQLRSVAVGHSYCLFPICMLAFLEAMTESQSFYSMHYASRYTRVGLVQRS